MRSLDVFINADRVGVLHEENDIWQFEYDADWLARPDSYDLSPGLSRKTQRHIDGSSTRPVQWYFDNLLPEETLRHAISKEAQVRGDDAFALLEYLGAESAGSLTLLPPGADINHRASLRALPNQALSQRIATLPQQTLAANAPKRMSLAGAQHKLLVVYRDGVLYEPEGITASTHILKPNHPDALAYPASVFNEYLTMRLARAAGVPTPNVHLRYVPEPVYIIDRFDRDITELDVDAQQVPILDVTRRHIIDACQLLNQSRIFKYNGASLDALKSVIAKTTNKTHTRTMLFRWLVFNILVANDDCHLKNLSFFISPEGIRLTEHYDLLATSAYYTRSIAAANATWPHVPMAIGLPGAKSFDAVTRAGVLEAGTELGLNAKTSERILTEVVTRVPAALEVEKAAMIQRHAGLAVPAMRFAPMETRLLGIFEHIILKEMLAKLQ